MKPIYEKINKPQDQSFYLEEVTRQYFPDPWHFHQEVEILYIKEGSGTKYVGNSINAFDPGDLVIIGSNIPHVWKCSSVYLNPENNLRSSAFCIQFMEGFLGDCIHGIPEMIRINEFLHQTKRGIQFVNSTRDTLIGQIEALGALAGMNRLIGLLAILDTMSVSTDFKYLNSPDYNPIKINSEDKARMEIVYQYVISHYESKISLEEIASLIYLTPQSFCRYFKSRTGKVFSSFVNEVRIGNACRMIIENNESISAICYSSGFNYLSNFNRQFKNIKGMTPSEYQRKFKTSDT
jgi:AraC-like DNA-binding protein